jgi:hypothetical protein
MGDQAGFCRQCGQALGVGQRFCSQCGSECSTVPGTAEGHAPEEGLNPPGLVWEANIGLLTNPTILKQLVTVLGITGLILAGFLSFLLAVDGEWHRIPEVLLISLLVVGALGLGMVLIMLVFFANRVRTRFTVNSEGIILETIDRRARAANRLAALLGALAGRPSTAGVGLMAMSRERESYNWRGIVRASYHPLWRGITLHDAWRTVALLACTPDNYEQVAAYVRQMVATAEARRAATSRRRARRAAPARSPLPRLLGRSVLVVLAALPVFLLPWPFELDPLVPLIMLCFALATVWLVHHFGWVVIAAALWIGAQIVLVGLEVHDSMFASLGTYRVYEALDTEEWVALALAAAGLAYLVIFSWRAARGHIAPALVEHGTEVDE